MRVVNVLLEAKERIHDRAPPMEKLTTLSKLLIASILVASSVTAYRTHGAKLRAGARPERTASPSAMVSPAPSAAPSNPLMQRPVRVALSQWPGHMAFVVGAGGLRTTSGSIADKHGLDVEIVFMEDPASKNKALQDGEVDFVWQTIDELPISLAGYRARGVEAKTFLQLDWSRGGDACVATQEVQKVEDIWGKKSAVMMFSPDHTMFEFMVANSRLSREQVMDVRRATKFSMDDITFARQLFAKQEVDVACMWEPDVTLALASRPGAHRLFSTADATELVADVLLARKDFLDQHLDVAQKLARTWFAAVEAGERDRPAAAKLISSVASRFRDELGYEKTLAALDWAKWTGLSDNVRLFGLDGSAPAFDRVYNQADGIWVNYPEAEITDRFAPMGLRDERAVRAIWEASGKPVAQLSEPYQQDVARTGAALFTKPISITFDSGSSELTTAGINLINQQILPQLQIAGGMYARVEGNTDSVGDRRENQQLSERRAAAIVSYLVSRGIPAARLVARGNGQTLPIASNRTPEGRAQNRRTDVLFIRKTKA